MIPGGKANTSSFPASPGLIAGAVVGGLAAVALIGLGAYFIIRHRHRARTRLQWEDVLDGSEDGDSVAREKRGVIEM